MKVTIILLITAFIFLACSSERTPPSKNTIDTKSIEYAEVSSINEAHASEDLSGADIAMIPPVTRSVTRSGHGGLAKVTIGSDTSNMNVRTHSYNVLQTLSQVKALKNTTTYVLFPKNISFHENKESKIYKRYATTLSLIQEMQEVDKSIDDNAPIRKKQNEFILLKKPNTSNFVTIQNYNYRVSHRIMNFFEDKYEKTLFKKDGPYFITVATNVWEKKNDFSFLMVDLSTYNDSAIKEVLESYKQRLIDKGNDKVGTLESWRYMLLTVLTTLNDDIHIFQTAVAGEL